MLEIETVCVEMNDYQLLDDSLWYTDTNHNDTLASGDFCKYLPFGQTNHLCCFVAPSEVAGDVSHDADPGA